ncbi:MAG TPA: STN domain-containing protein, partial [Anseongella sp.]|nr:STN domain-containing protein [Anseongella sp.]
MKLSMFLAIITLTQVNAAVYSQEITLNEEGAQLRTVLEQIKRQSGYNLFYDAADIRQAERISIHVKNVSVEEALRQCFEGRNLSFRIIEKT